MNFGTAGAAFATFGTGGFDGFAIFMVSRFGRSGLGSALLAGSGGNFPPVFPIAPLEGRLLLDGLPLDITFDGTLSPFPDVGGFRTSAATVFVPRALDSPGGVLSPLRLEVLPRLEDVRWQPWGHCMVTTVEMHFTWPTAAPCVADFP